MPYPTDSIEGRLLANDRQALGEVVHWIAGTIAQTKFWPIRPEWNDVAQESLVRVVESLRQERFDPLRDFRAYVQGVARHTALNTMRSALRRQRRRGLALDDGDPGARTGNVESVASDHQLVRQVLDMASEECRRLFRAYFYEEMTYAQIGEKISAPLGTVKSRLFRCLKAASAAIQAARHRGTGPHAPRRPAALPERG